MGAKELPRGIEVRNGRSLRIAFTYQGVRCRESLSKRTNCKKDIRYAESLLSEINRRIGDNSFKYADYFPKSKRLKLFGEDTTNSTFKKYRQEYLELQEGRNLKPITLRGYNTCANRLKMFDPLPITSINVPQLTIFVSDMVKRKLANKTIRNTMSVLRSIMNLATQHGAVPSNVCLSYEYNNLLPKGRTRSKKENSIFVDPFSPIERDLIINGARQRYDSLGNMIQFMFYTGLRISEVFALTWDDIDFIRNSVSVNKAFVDGKLNDSTKTDKGMRDVELEPKALEALTAQKQHTFVGGDLIFLAPYENKPWRIDHQLREGYWKGILKRAGVKYRYPYQTRHTYATMMISEGRNLFWLADQLGHEDPTMLFRHYGKFLKEHEMVKTPQKSPIFSESQ